MTAMLPALALVILIKSNANNRKAACFGISHPDKTNANDSNAACFGISNPDKKQC